MKYRIWNPFNTLAVLSLLSPPLSTAFAQGNLTPPGAPAPTMKSLDQIEPRTPISSVPFTILAHGSYYLTTNLTASAGQSGISINSDDVTLDLNGFALDGGVNKTNFIINGIAILFHTNVCVRNGTIRNWGGFGISAVFSANSRFENLRVSDGGLVGVSVGKGCFVGGCSVTTSGLGGNQGIAVGDGSTIKDCVVTTNYIGISTGAGCVISGCAASRNGFAGFSLGPGSIVKDCSASFNVGDGIVAGESAAIATCSVRSNSGSGLNLLRSCTVTACTIEANGQYGIFGLPANTIHDCTVADNGGIGILAGSGSTVRNCSVRASGLDGIRVDTNCFVLENVCAGNGATVDGNTHAGIRVTGDGNRIDGNHCRDNIGNGIRVDLNTSNNLIVRNSSGGSTIVDYSISGSNKVGPTVSDPTDFGANAWANFQDLPPL